MAQPYHYDLWLMSTWKRADGRYYCCVLQENLLGEWVVIRHWGGQHSHRQGVQETVCDNYQQGIQELQTIAKRRLQRGYKLTQSL